MHYGSWDGVDLDIHRRFNQSTELFEEFTPNTIRILDFPTALVIPMKFAPGCEFKTKLVEQVP